MIFTYNYPRPCVTVDALVLSKHNGVWNIVLIKRKQDPFQGKWAFPGGFMDMDEELLDAVNRELMEETGIAGLQLNLFTTIGTVNRDPRHRTISVIYYAFCESLCDLKAGDDAENAEWFSINELPELAFDHSQILSDFVGKEL